MYAYVDADNAIWLRGVSTINFTTGERAFLTGLAIVTFRVQTADHIDLPGTTWPEAMHYIAGSQGDFLGVLSDTLTWEPDQTYRLIATVEAGPDQKRTWDMPLRTLVSQE
jgi:hypothetical protein